LASQTKKKNTDGEENGNTGGNKGGGTERGIKKDISGRINKESLFKKKEFVTPFFLRRLRPRPFLPRL